MKVLWFTNKDFLSLNKDYNGGGWMSSLRDEILKRDGIDLAIASMSWRLNKECDDGVTYYQTFYRKSFISKLLDKFKSYESVCKLSDAKYVRLFMDIIDDYNPDLIEIWGTENNYGLIIPYTKIPCVIHLQGILNPYLNCLLPPTFSRFDFLLSKGLSALRKKYIELKSWKYQIEREKIILSNCQYLSGRTEWDKNISTLYANQAQYFVCNEMLRNKFYNASKWKMKINSPMKLLSVISSPLYKGVDLILKTAKILCEQTNVEFEWDVFGIEDVSFVEKHINVHHNKVHINVCGIINADDVIRNMMNADLYIHPSYIDNSPNSICEAQYIGVPVIACNVGGVSSLIKNRNTGFLVPANDPYSLSAIIKYIRENTDLLPLISKNEIAESERRHNKDRISEDAISTYSYIINESDKN